MTSLHSQLQGNSFPGKHFIRNLVIRYDGLGKELNHDETEILLFALYCESLAGGGIVKAAREVERKLELARQRADKKGVKQKTK